MKFKTDAAFEPSCLQGHVDISYQELCEVFGNPNSNGDGYKVDAEWQIKFADGTYSTIYNYKTGRNYCGEQGMDVEDITYWHVGGMGKQSLWSIMEAIQDHRAGI
jgi:hypothetical protein